MPPQRHSGSQQIYVAKHTTHRLMQVDVGGELEIAAKHDIATKGGGMTTTKIAEMCALGAPTTAATATPIVPCQV